jgi:hypothetical protein
MCAPVQTIAGHGHTILPTMKTIRRSATTVACVLALSGCLSTKYQAAPNGGPAPNGGMAPTLLSIPDAEPPVDVDQRSFFVYGGPRSAIQATLWDEYAVTIHNPSSNPITVIVAALSDFSDTPSSPRVDRWAPDKDSQILEQRYRRDGMNFARSSAPQALFIGDHVASVGSASEAVAAGVGVRALPVYYVVVWNKNRSNDAAIPAEFARRQLTFPLTLAAGEKRTGSIFFPVVPDPQSLSQDLTRDPKREGIGISMQTLAAMHTAAQQCADSGAAAAVPCT